MGLRLKSFTLHNDVVTELLEGTGIKFGKKATFQTVRLIFSDRKPDTAELEVAHQTVTIPKSQALKIARLASMPEYSHYGKRPPARQPRKLRG